MARVTAPFAMVQRKAKQSLVRRQLLALLMVLCVPYVVILGLSAARQSNHDRDVAGKNMLNAALLTASRLDDHVGDLAQLLSILSTVVGTDHADRPRNNALLHDLIDRLPPQINNLNVWDADGANVGSLRPQISATSMIVRDRKFFRDAAARPGVAVEAPIVSTLNGQMVGVFAMRIEREGRFVGVISVAARLQHLQDLLVPPGSLPEGTVVAVSDENGILLARSLDPEKWIGKNISGGTSNAVENRKSRQGVRESSSADGVQRISGFTLATKVPWLVYVGQPTETALGPARANLLDQVAIGGVLMIVGLLLAHWISERIAQPLRQLEHDAKLLEDGNLSHRTVVTGAGEIGSLAATLNRMAQSLELRTQLLEASEDRLRRLAQFDPLTGLANRSLFMERLGARIDEAARQRSGFTLLFIDVDHFKAVNDTHGHRAGDDVLMSFARSLERGVAAGDTVARLAGDEFMIILNAVDDLDVASAIAQKLVDSVRTTVGAGKRAVQVSASVGVALFEFGENGSAMLNRADEALYMAKRMGRDRVRVAFRSENRVLESVSER